MSANPVRGSLPVPLADGYGVVIGSLKKHWIDPPDTQGRWPHYNMTVETTAGEYHCVVNLKSRSEVKVEYRDFRSAGTTSFASVLAKPNGFHPLPRTSTSGALDFIRHPGLQDQPGCSCTHWLKENGVNLMQLMEYYLIGAQRVLVFGEPYATGLGVHNVHMNQGDPVGSPFAGENAIWQDGGILLEHAPPQQRLSALLTRFETQSLQTDALGQPL